MKITLCGSARFEKEFHEANKRLSLEGHVVYTLSVFPSQAEGKKEWYTPEQKTILDKVHFDKIKNSDAIYIVSKGSYIGESTAKEIVYADKLGLKIYCAYPHGKHFQCSTSYESFSLKGDMIRTCSYKGCASLLACGPCALCYE